MPGPVQRSNSQLGLLTGQMDSGKMPLYDAKPAKAGGLRRWASEAQVQALLALALLLLVAGCWTATRPLQTASPVLLQSHVSMASGDPKQVLGEGARLLLVQAVFRHGARTPLSQLYWPATEWHVCPRVYPGVGLDIRDSRGAAQPPPVLDPVMPALPGGNCTMGTLTTAGYQQALALGSYLRSRYVAGEKLLSGDYEPSAVFAHTTSMRRTIATLRGVLSGLYPSDAAKGTSVLVNATAEPHNFMYAKNTSCAAVGPILEELWRKAEDAEASDANQRKMKVKVQAALGLPANVPVDWSRLRDKLSAMLAANIAPPRALPTSLWKTIDRQATSRELLIHSPTASTCLVKASQCADVVSWSIGPLVWRLVQSMQQAADCSRRGDAAGSDSSGKSIASSSACQVPTLRLYAGHDTTVMPLVHTVLQQPMREWPPFASNVIFELWEAPHQRALGHAAHYVRVLYDQQPINFASQPAAVRSHGGPLHGELISMETFSSLVKPYVMSDDERYAACWK